MVTPNYISYFYNLFLDIDECSDNALNACSSINGQWCVNLPGTHLCCSAESKEIECHDHQLKKPLKINFNTDEFIKSSNKLEAEANAKAQNAAKVRVYGRKFKGASEVLSSEINNETDENFKENKNAGSQIENETTQAKRERISKISFKNFSKKFRNHS